jgi:hypothetical protein
MKIQAILLALLPLAAFGDDLDSVLAVSAPANEPVEATFKTIRVVESQSVETTHQGELNGTISHRFGQFSTGVDDLWGLDFASMRIGLDYGFTEWLDLGVERSQEEGKPVDLWGKFRVLRQTTSGNIPLSVTWYSAGYVLTETSEGLGYSLPLDRRLSSTNQLIMARKFSEDLSLQVAPTLVTRQLRPNNGDGEVAMGVGFSGRYKLSQRFAITGETTPMFYGVSQTWDPACAVGVDIETGGHVFQLYVGNNTYLTDDRMYTQTKTGPHTALDLNTLAFGFNITRGWAM